jgi:hypothetical protein
MTQHEARLQVLGANDCSNKSSLRIIFQFPLTTLTGCRLLWPRSSLQHSPTCGEILMASTVASCGVRAADMNSTRDAKLCAAAPFHACLLPGTF